MKNCGLLADGQTLKQIANWESAMISEHGFSCNAGSLVVPSEGHGILLHYVNVTE